MNNNWLQDIEVRQPRAITEDYPLASKTEPWAHQRKAYEFAYPKEACMLALDMGLGKSKVTVDLATNWGCRRVLILCPKSVIPVWARQFAMHAAEDWNVLCLQAGSVAKKAEKAIHHLEWAEMREERLAIVINYESAWRPPFGPVHDQHNRLIDVGFARSVDWDLVILDESHRIKAPGGAASWFCRDLAAKAARRLCLTGTPMPHSPLDLYAQMRFLDTAVFGTNFTRFKRRYAVLGGFEDKVCVGWKNQRDMAEKLYSRCILIKGEEADLKLPDGLHEYRTFDLGPKAMTIYLQLMTSLAAQVQSGEVTASNALVKLLRLQQLTGGTVTTDEGDSYQVDAGKADLLRDILEDLHPEEPVVVFARFSRDLEVIAAVADKLKRSYRELSGRINELEEWQAGNGDILGVQIQAGKEGVDLTRARYCIYYSLGFSLGDYEQSLKRCLRPGQTRNVYYYHLLANNTVDQDVYKSLQEKRGVVDSVLDALKGGGDNV